jgi:hypothetical protein
MPLWRSRLQQRPHCLALEPGLALRKLRNSEGVRVAFGLGYELRHDYAWGTALIHAHEGEEFCKQGP